MVCLVLLRRYAHALTEAEACCGVAFLTIVLPGAEEAFVVRVESHNSEPIFEGRYAMPSHRGAGSVLPQLRSPQRRTIFPCCKMWALFLTHNTLFLLLDAPGMR